MNTYVATAFTSGIDQPCTIALLVQGHQVVSLCRDLKKVRDLFSLAFVASQLMLIEHDFDAKATLYRKCLDVLISCRINGLIHCNWTGGPL